MDDEKNSAEERVAELEHALSDLKKRFEEQARSIMNREHDEEQARVEKREAEKRYLIFWYILFFATAIFLVVLYSTS